MKNFFKPKDYGIGLLGIGTGVPETVVPNQFFEENITGITNEKIIKVTGIEERRRAKANEPSSELCLRAAKEALKNAKLEADEIDMVIVGTASPDYKTPPTATIILNRLNINHKPGFDINSGGCANAIFSLITAATYLEHNPNIKILVVAGENFAGLLDWKDKTSIYFGDGASAYIVGKVEKNKGFINYKFKSITDKIDKLIVHGGGSAKPLSLEELQNNDGIQYLRMDGKAIWDFATKEFPECVEEVIDTSGFSKDDINMIIPHQANINIIKRGMQKLNLPLEKTFININRYGNTSGASVGIAFHEALEKGLVKKDDLVVLVGFGAGLAIGSILMRM